MKNGTWGLVLALFACAEIATPPSGRVGGFVPPPSEAGRLGMASANTRALDYQRRAEWPRHRSDRGAPPQLCITLSGGGLRSASFGIGVLSALHELGHLDRTDLISSVSGGSYAASWLYGQLLYNDELTAARLLDRAGPPQGELAGNAPDIVNARTGLQAALAMLVFIPLNFVADGLFDWNWNLSATRSRYQANLQRVFHTPHETRLAPEQIRMLADRALGRGMHDLQPLLEDPGESPETPGSGEARRLPLWILNTTAQLDGGLVAEGNRLYRSVFEISPLHYGSDYFGYWHRDAFTVVEATGLSGAAVDSNYLENPIARTLASALVFDLGQVEANRAVPTWERWAHKALPIPFYMLHRYGRDREGVSIVLTDGGHSENLGLFTAVRRLCRNIIVVDAEHDPNQTFEGYGKLQHSLEREMRVRLQVEPIDETRAVWSDLRELQDVLETDDRTTLPRARGVLGRLSDTESSRGFDPAEPVMIGKVGTFPFEGGGLDLQIRYIKLSLDEEHLGEMPSSVQEYRRETVNRTYVFPQEPTTDQNFTELQFRAYRDLGYCIVKTFQARFDFTPGNAAAEPEPWRDCLEREAQDRVATE